MEKSFIEERIDAYEGFKKKKNKKKRIEREFVIKI